MWFRVDDTFVGHPKTRQAAELLGGSKKRARGRVVAVWLEAGTWSSRYLTNGYVPENALDDFLTDSRPGEVMAACAKAGLFRRENGGYYFHQWEERQLEAEPVKDAQAIDAQRKQIHQIKGLVDTIRKRDADRCRYCGRVVNFKDRRGDLAGTYDFMDPAGPRTADNIVVCCHGCRRGRSQQTDESLSGRLLTTGAGTDQARNQISEQVQPSFLTISQVVTRSELEISSRAHARDPVPSRPVPNEKPKDPRGLRRAMPIRMGLSAITSHLKTAVHGFIESRNPKFFDDRTGAILTGQVVDELKDFIPPTFKGISWRHSTELTRIVDAVVAERERRDRKAAGRRVR